MLGFNGEYRDAATGQSPLGIGVPLVSPAENEFRKNGHVKPTRRRWPEYVWILCQWRSCQLSRPQRAPRRAGPMDVPLWRYGAWGTRVRIRTRRRIDQRHHLGRAWHTHNLPVGRFNARRAGLVGRALAWRSCRSSTDQRVQSRAVQDAGLDIPGGGSTRWPGIVGGKNGDALLIPGANRSCGCQKPRG